MVSTHQFHSLLAAYKLLEMHHPSKGCAHRATPLFHLMRRSRSRHPTMLWSSDGPVVQKTKKNIGKLQCHVMQLLCGESPICESSSIPPQLTAKQAHPSTVQSLPEHTAATLQSRRDLGHSVLLCLTCSHEALAGLATRNANS